MEILGKNFPATIIDKEDGIIKEKINTKDKITNKEAEEAEETEEETMVIQEGYILNLGKSSKMDTVGNVDGEQTTKAPNFRQLEGHVANTTHADTKNGSDKNKGWN